MELAIVEAEAAFERGEVPIGAVVVMRGQLVGAAGNNRQSLDNPLGHAEVLAIQAAAEKLETWHLNGAELFVTVEPCAMCSGVVLQTGISRVVYGASNHKDGCAGTILNLLDYPGMSRRAEVRGGLLDTKCSSLLQRFFKSFRV